MYDETKFAEADHKLPPLDIRNHVARLDRKYGSLLEETGNETNSL